MAATPFVLGVDVGSGATRVVAVGPDGEVLADAADLNPQQSTWPQGRVDPPSWLSALDSAFSRIATLLPTGAAASALAIGGQSPTTVPARGGLAVTCAHPAGADLTPDQQHAAQWQVLHDEAGDRVVPCQLWDWLLQQLGAPRVQGRWPGEPALTGYGDRVDTGSVIGRSDGSHGLPAGIPLVPGAQDAYLSFWAGGLDEPGRGLDPGGRTGGLGVAIEAGHRPATLYALPSAAKGIDIVGGPTAAHGWVLEWWSRFTGRTIPDLLDAAAAVEPGAGGVIALPYLNGERAPRWMPSLRAQVAGISTSTGPAEVCRALLEGTAYGLAHIAGRLMGDGVQFQRLTCGGSPARSRLWCTIKAAVLERPVEIPTCPELTAYGAAMAAGAALGWWPGPGAGQRGDWPRLPVDVIDPQPLAVYRDGYARFVALGDLAEQWTRTTEDSCPTP